MPPKVAVTFFAASMVTTQSPVVFIHDPVHPENLYHGRGVAVRVTTVSSLNIFSHTVPQSIPAGEDVTVPCSVDVTVRE